MNESLLLTRIAQQSLAEHTRRTAIRSIASRVVLALALLGLLSGMLPLRRMHLLREILPFTMPGASSAAIVLLSAMLLITSRGLRRGVRLAWIAALAVLLVSAVLHVTKGPVLVTLFDAIGAGWLAAQGRCFPVWPTPRALRWSRIVGAVLTVVLVSVIVTIVVVTTVGEVPAETLHNLDAAVDRPVTRLLSIGFLLVLLWSLFSPTKPPRLPARDHLTQRERAREIVAAWGTGSLDYFALRDDKDWFFAGECVIAYSVRGGICLVSPDPIGPPGEREAVWVEFLEYAYGLGWSVAVIAADRNWLPIYEAAGLRTVYLGDEAVVHCPDFTMAGHANKSLRQAVNRVERRGYVTTFHDPVTIDPDIKQQILEICHESRQGDVERGYSMTLSRMFDPHDTGLLMSVTRNADGRVDAVCQWVPSPAIDGWSLDVMRRRLEADDLPNGVIDQNIVATIREMVRTGRSGLALNFAVMRQVLDGEGVSRLDSLTRPVLQRLSQNTQMSSLSSFNEKFDPQWRPRYVAVDSAEYVAFQALVMADAEGVTEIPIVGKLLTASRDGSKRNGIREEAPAALIAPRAPHPEVARPNEEPAVNGTASLAEAACLDGVRGPTADGKRPARATAARPGRTRKPRSKDVSARAEITHLHSTETALPDDGARVPEDVARPGQATHPDGAGAPRG